MTKYEIHVGKIYDLDSKSYEPKLKWVITEEQFEVIKQFANTKKDKDLNTTYIINDIEFQVWPDFEF
jgi:hypothetical protein